MTSKKQRRSPQRVIRYKIPGTSNAMSHGLSSRVLVEKRVEEVRLLARQLAKGVPYTSEVQKAAEALAECLFACQAIQRTRLDLLTPPSTGASVGYVEELLDKLDRLGRYPESDRIVYGEMVSEDLGTPTRNRWLLFDTFSSNRTELRKMEEYERKAYSRFLKLVSRLDYEMIEAQRRK